MFSNIKSWFAKPPPPNFSDSELGVLTLDSGIWMGTAQLDGRTLRFLVAGTENAPDAGLLGCVRSLLARFPTVEQSAIDFLRQKEPELHQAHLDFYSLEFLWEDRPDDFAFEFLLAGDESRIWRVEFVAGQPAISGFDD